MKYIKLFEQFEDNEDAWWEKESQFDNIKDLKIIYNSHTFYLAQEIADGELRIFHNHHNSYDIRDFKISPKVFGDDIVIVIYDIENKYGVDNMGNNLMGWKYFKLNELPKEIKDRIDF